MTEVLLIRHGLTDASDRWYSGRMPGVNLNERGRTQVLDLARRLSEVMIDAVYSSPLERCVETAEAVAGPHGLTVNVDEAFTEVDVGDWTGKKFDELRRDVQFARFKKFRSGTRPPNGEVTVEVQARMVAGILRLAGSHPHQTVVVVSHSDPLQSLLCYLLGIPVDIGYRLSISPASVSVLEIDGDDLRVNLVNHLGPLGILEM